MLTVSLAMQGCHSLGRGVERLLCNLRMRGALMCHVENKSIGNDQQRCFRRIADRAGFIRCFRTKGRFAAKYADSHGLLEQWIVLKRILTLVDFDVPAI